MEVRVRKCNPCTHIETNIGRGYDLKTCVKNKPTKSQKNRFIFIKLSNLGLSIRFLNRGGGIFLIL